MKNIYPITIFSLFFGICALQAVTLDSLNKNISEPSSLSANNNTTNPSRSPLYLRLSDSQDPHQIVFDKNNPDNSEKVVFNFPIFDTQGRWSYRLDPQGEEISILALTAGVDSLLEMNYFTGQFEYSTWSNMVFIPCDTGKTLIRFFYSDNSYAIVRTCDFEIDVVAPTDENKAATPSADIK